MFYLEYLLVLSIVLTYLVIAIVSGFNLAYRVIHGKKLSIYELILSIMTLPLSIIIFMFSIVGMFSFGMKRMSDGWERPKELTTK